MNTMTQETLARRIYNELEPLSRDCATDVMHDLLLADDTLHMGIMSLVIDYYVAHLSQGEEIDGYKARKV